MKRIGLFGGTFDPIHNGHFQLAEAACHECQLDHVLFVPAASPPHKPTQTVASYEHRVEMVRLVCAVNNRFSCSCIESDLPSPTFTVDTLRAIQRSFTDEVQLYFLIGVDAFLEIMTWKEYKVVLSFLNFVLCPRQLFDRDAFLDIMVKLEYCNSGSTWSHKEYKNLFELSAIPDNVSSTEVRNSILSGDRFIENVDPKVIQYITDQGLYGDFC